MEKKKVLITVSSNKGQMGFSLVELIVTIGVSSIILLMSLQIVNEQMKLGIDFDEKMSVSLESQTLSRKIGKILETAGGQGLAPWQSVKVENNCGPSWVFPDCQGSDRVTFMTSKVKSNGTLFATKTVQDYSFDGTIKIIPWSGEVSGCPLLPLGDPACMMPTIVTVFCEPLDELQDEVVTVFSTTGEVMTRRVTGFDNNTCTLATTIDKQSQSFTNTAVSIFPLATLSVVKVMTLFYDRDQKKILTFIDKNNDNVLDSDEIKSQIENIFDFQLALGYDFSPKDGSISDTSSNTDEWLYNSPGEFWGGVGYFNTTSPLSVKYSDLTMIKVSCITGNPTKSGAASGTFQMLDGPSISGQGYNYRKFDKKIMFKNLTTF